MEYLYRRLKNDYGVRFIRQALPSIQSAFSNPATKVVFNCTGNAARTLPGVEDPKCYPTRGQVLLTRAPQVKTNMMRHGRDYETYVIPRPQSNGNVILGGYMQRGNGYVHHYLTLGELLISRRACRDGATYGYETESILDRTKALSPELRQGGQELLGVLSGLRPSRDGGARVERDELVVAGKRRALVHNYGAGGTGFQAGYGMAMDAVKAAEDILRQVKAELRPRL